MAERTRYWAERVVVGAAALLMLSAFAPVAAAQSGFYRNDTSGVVGGGTACGTTNLTRTINVPDSFTITDVNFGIVAQHGYRRDIRVNLVHPNGVTRVDGLIAGPGDNTQADDLNVLLDQANGTTINSDTVDFNSSLGRYQRTRRPDASLNTFNTLNAQGNWTVELCDSFPGADDGTFLFGQLLFNNVVPVSSDLSLTLNASNTSPVFGDSVTYTLNVANAGTSNSNGIQARFQLPTGLTYTSDNGAGSYNSVTGVWTIPGTINSGASRTLLVTATVNTSGSYTSLAEVLVAPNPDPDSTPGNAGAAPLEDDTDSENLTPGFGGTPGTAPTLTCTLTQRIFDWDNAANNWPVNTNTGDTSETRSYPTGGSDGLGFTFAFTGDYNRRIAIDGLLTPYSGTGANGNQTYGQVGDSLIVGQDTQDTTEQTVLTASVGTPGIGVEAMQFRVFDIDFLAGQFQDRVTFSGSLNGLDVSPILTAGPSNTIFGDSAVGTATAADNTSNGTVVVTFLQPVDTVVVEYDNIDTDLVGTRQQGLAFGDFDYCPRPIDFGDIALTYGEAGHAIKSGYSIGSVAPDNETATQVSADADADDTIGTADEGGIAFTSLFAGSTGNIDVPVTGSGGFLQVWIDWNGDGDFDDTVDSVSEQVASNLQTPGFSGTISVPVTVPASAVLTATKARLRWSTQSGIGTAGTAPDGEVEDYQITITGAAMLSGNKVNAVYDPGAIGLYALPGNDIIYSINVSNVGAGPTDPDTLFLYDEIPDEVEFWNGDIDSGGPDTFTGAEPVGFVQADGAALMLTYATDIAFSTAATPPATFADCTAIAPDDTYRPDINYICANPRGQLTAGDPDPNVTLSFRTRIK